MVKNNHGFSLVELSIVLVILGLLVGGILAGKGLIRASELRSVMTDVVRYKTAVNSFRDKYFALPGDMTNATSFWTAADGNDGLGSDCYNIITAPVGTETCNGNGDGKIGLVADITREYEVHRLWQHLQNAGLVEGKLTGGYKATGSPAFRESVVGVNVPQSRISGAGFEIIYYNSINQILFGSVFYSAGYPLEIGWPALLPEEAWNIDQKMDDGLPLTGGVTVSPYNTSNMNCPNVANTAYALSTTTLQCPLYFQLGM